MPTIPDNQGRLLLNVDETLNDSDKVIAVSINARWAPISLWYEFTATATVGTRLMEVHVRDDAADIIAGMRAANVTASQTQKALHLFRNTAATITSGAGAATFTAEGAPSNSVLFAWPFDRLPQSFDIRVFDLAAIDAAADDLIIQYLVEEWIED